eukprot:jgi/Chrpa1/6817/Chrysochromulina_OHIO_Genome00009102-RA
MWTAEALAAPNLTATSAEPEAPIDPEHDLGANTKASSGARPAPSSKFEASSGARPAPSSKFGPCGPWLGPATYSPHIPDPKDKRLGLDPIPVGVTYGAKSEFYQPKPSFFNILYTHPLFGHMGPWAQDKAYYLPPVNSTEGAMVPPSDRRLARVYGHNDVPVGCLAATNTSAAAAQWGALGAGAKAIHSGETIQFLMKTRTEFKYRSSPSMHPAPAPALPEMPRTRARTTSVSKSTHPLKRLPAHTVWRMQTDQILYGPKASQDTAAIAIKSRGAAKDSRSQFGF